jgi:hypothetical protein
MPRYILRNQDKISASLGKDYVKLLLNSLKDHFKSNKEIEEHTYENLKYKIIHVHNVQKNTDSIFEFAIVKKTFDVYTLAYYSCLS